MKTIALIASLIALSTIVGCAEPTTQDDGVVTVDASAFTSVQARTYCFEQVGYLTYGKVTPKLIFGAGDVTLPAVAIVNGDEGIARAVCQRLILSHVGAPLHAGKGILGDEITTAWSDADAASLAVFE